MIRDWKRYAHKALLTLLAALFMLWAAGCGGSADAPAAETEPETAAAAADERMTETANEAETSAETPAEASVLTLTILATDGTEIAVPVTWEDCETVRALADLAAASPGGSLTVLASAYGGFEQVGDLGQALPRDDVRITTEPGDIVLYAGHSISVFSAPNTWEYTLLGHIDLSAAEIEELLSGSGVTMVFRAG